MIKKIALAQVAILLCTNALALNCEKAVTQTDMNICAGKNLEIADKELNKVYKKIMTNKDKEFRNLMKVSQNAWIKLKEADCKRDAYPTKGGSVQPMVYGMCLEEKTKARTEELKKILNCEEGDFTCMPK